MRPLRHRPDGGWAGASATNDCRNYADAAAGPAGRVNNNPTTSAIAALPAPQAALPGVLVTFSPRSQSRFLFRHTRVAVAVRVAGENQTGNRDDMALLCRISRGLSDCLRRCYRAAYSSRKENGR